MTLLWRYQLQAVIVHYNVRFAALELIFPAWIMILLESDDVTRRHLSDDCTQGTCKFIAYNYLTSFRTDLCHKGKHKQDTIFWSTDVHLVASGITSLYQRNESAESFIWYQAFQLTSIPTIPWTLAERNFYHRYWYGLPDINPHQQASRIDKNVGFKVMSKDSLYTGTCNQDQANHELHKVSAVSESNVGRWTSVVVRMFWNVLHFSKWATEGIRDGGGII